jgi:hypothetical protein
MSVRTSIIYWWDASFVTWSNRIELRRLQDIQLTYKKMSKEENRSRRRLFAGAQWLYTTSAMRAAASTESGPVVLCAFNVPPDASVPPSAVVLPVGAPMGAVWVSIVEKPAATEDAEAALNRRVQSGCDWEE